MEMTASEGGDLARRVAQRRESLGLTREQVARRAGMDQGFLDYLEHSPDATATVGSLIRLAVALDTTPAFLTGGTADRPPGPGRAGHCPSLEALTREQCEAHLAAGGVGRLVFEAEHGPLALPVNFRFAGGDIVFRTTATGPLAAVAGTMVSFEVDQIDEAMSEGWSVIVSGEAYRVDEPTQLAQLESLELESWAGGGREAMIRIEVREMSGRRIRQHA